MRLSLLISQTCIAVVAAMTVFAPSAFADKADKKDYLAERLQSSGGDPIRLKVRQVKLFAKQNSRFQGTFINCRGQIIIRPKSEGYQRANLSVRGNDQTYVYLPESKCDKQSTFVVNGTSSDTLVMHSSITDLSRSGGKMILHFASDEERRAHFGVGDAYKSVSQFSPLANTFICESPDLNISSVREALRGRALVCVANESNPDFTGHIEVGIVNYYP